MLRTVRALAVAVLLVGALGTPALAARPTSTGFDQYGYNDTARIFNGLASGWCLAKGQPEDCLGPYSNDRLVMKWNAEWDRGNAENWADGPYSAWLTNEWNGKVPGGSGYTEHVKIVWVGACVDGTTLSDGGVCIWGQFETIMDQGVDPTAGHTWYTKAVPNGFGVVH